MKVKSEREVTQSCLTPSDPMDCSPPGSSIHKIFLAIVNSAAMNIGGTHVFFNLVFITNSNYAIIINSSTYLENPMDGGAWEAAVHGVAKSQIQLSDFTFMHWRRKWQPTPVFLPGESQGRGSLVGCRLWGCTESDTTEVT